MASDGMAGVTRVAEDRPDLVLVDLGLSVMNGSDVARAIRSCVRVERHISASGRRRLQDAAASPSRNDISTGVSRADR